MLQQRHHVFALSFACSGFCPSRFLSRAIGSLFLSLRKNTEQNWMKFAGGSHYHEQIKWFHFGRNWNRDKGSLYQPVFLPQCQISADA